MGHHDQAAENDDILCGIAVSIAIRTGLLESCPIHQEVFDPLQHDYEAAYKLGNYLITKSDPLVALFDGDRKSLSELLQDVCSGYGDCCPICANNAAS